MPKLRRRKTMTKEEVRNIVAAVYPEVGEDRELSLEALLQLKALVEMTEEHHPSLLSRYEEIINFVQSQIDERTKR